MSEIMTVVGLFFLMGFIALMIGIYDSSLCPQSEQYLNETLATGTNETFFQQAQNVVSHAFTLKCSGVPFWFNFFIYIPIIIGLIYSVIPFK